jgi:hypothetical protein
MEHGTGGSDPCPREGSSTGARKATKIVMNMSKDPEVGGLSCRNYKRFLEAFKPSLLTAARPIAS